MDWIHCNLCSQQPRNSNPGFILTSCGHIFCEKCENRETVDKCKVCGSPCAVTKLTANMKPEVRAYFEDTEEIVKKLLQTIRFQKSHRFSLFKAYKKVGDKYQAAKSHIRKVESQNSTLKRKLEHYEKSKILSSPRSSEFHFTPETNHRDSVAFNSVSTQNSAKPDRQNFSFRVPDFQAYQQYRNVVQKTPNISPAEITPRNQSSANISYKRNVATPRIQSQFPMRTPPYNDFQGMKITAQKYK